MPLSADTPLGAFLKDCRHRIDPSVLGFPTARRRTPGLRREEVAQRANISPAWYTWLEQGRGGAPSPEVLDRIAHGLMLTDTEREHLFLLGLGHPPGVQYRVSDSVTPRLQRVLDALDVSPAIVKTATWDVVAWNRAAAAVLTDYGRLAPAERNILRLIFAKASERAANEDWQAMARVVVGSFRADAVRAGATDEIDALVDELCGTSPEFEAMWRDNDVRAHGEGVKRLHHPTAGLIELEYSSFAVEGRPDLGMIVYNPAGAADAERVRSLIRAMSQP